MKVKDLKAILNGMPDDSIIVVEDPYGACINLNAHAETCGRIIYLESVHTFPDEWYTEEGLEIGWDYEEEAGLC